MQECVKRAMASAELLMSDVESSFWWVGRASAMPCRTFCGLSGLLAMSVVGGDVHCVTVVCCLLSGTEEMEGARRDVVAKKVGWKVQASAVEMDQDLLFGLKSWPAGSSGGVRGVCLTVGLRSRGRRVRPRHAGKATYLGRYLGRYCSIPQGAYQLLSS